MLTGDVSDYDEELYQKLRGRSRETMCRFFEEFKDELEDADSRRYVPSTFTQKTWRKILAGRLPSWTIKWLNDHQRFKRESVRTDPAVEYLASHYEIEGERLQVGSIYELLVLIYEENLRAELDEIITGARIRNSSPSHTYLLPTEIELDQLSERLNRFHRKWNKGDENDSTPIKAARVVKEIDGEESTLLNLHVETGKSSARTFEFRKEGEGGQIPTTPEVGRVEYHSIKHVRIMLEKSSGDTVIVFTKDPSNWQTFLDELFEVSFGVDDFMSSLKEQESQIAEELENEAIDSIKSGEDPVNQTQRMINTRSKRAIENVEKSDLPDDKKQEIKSCLNSIEYSGTEIDRDHSLSTRQFSLMSEDDLSSIFEKVDIKDGFIDFLNKADEENRAFVINLDGRGVAVQNGKPTPVDNAPLSNTAQKALQYFFGYDEPL